ncbi:plasmid mobilization relaxosome protein MobC [Allobranchiibius sp. GilTou38]|uniref:plasmid mobilization relaxosome protein MobC n=1 Tax=Allobranchiibius sp. GilTou38 TaxID=2815210 RepID=UPI001AA102C5|nr:plasmid mobilization relaxosome protein MobC [Allobranchiibius sp. GilTou38]
MSGDIADGSDEGSRPRVLRRYRRANAGGGPRGHRVVITHTDEEWVRVKSLAEVQGVTVPRLYARAVFARDVVAAARVEQVHLELYGVRRLLAGAATNINQIARVANATDDVDGAALAGAVDLLERQIGRLNELLKGLPGSELT